MEKILIQRKLKVSIFWCGKVTAQNLSRSVVKKSATMLFLTQTARKILCVVHMKENGEVENETVTSSLHIHMTFPYFDPASQLIRGQICKTT